VHRHCIPHLLTSRLFACTQQDEIAHVNFLRSTLGMEAVSMPLIDVGPAFAAAANAAFNTTLEPAFDPYANDLFFYHGAFIFEDVGVTAYKVRGLIRQTAWLPDIICRQMWWCTSETASPCRPQ
jgi:hypothetical protein